VCVALESTYEHLCDLVRTEERRVEGALNRRGHAKNVLRRGRLEVYPNASESHECHHLCPKRSEDVH
jgi:hypothetical protein